MKAWIGINVISSNQGLLNAVENALPHKLDTRLWNTDEFVIDRKLDDTTGQEYICASMFFNDFNERNDFKAILGGISGFLNAALPGSFIKMTKCWHDELLSNGTPVASDEIEFEEIV